MRIAHKFTQKSMAAELGVKLDQFSNWEFGVEKIEAYHLYRLTIIFDCEISDFFIGLNLSQEAL